MKKMLLTLVLGLTAMTAVAQSGNSEIKALKPANESPATFASQEDLNEKAPQKIQELKNMIREHEGNEEKLKALREKLWRFENAIVVKQ